MRGTIAACSGSQPSSTRRAVDARVGLVAVGKLRRQHGVDPQVAEPQQVDEQRDSAVKLYGAVHGQVDVRPAEVGLKQGSQWRHGEGRHDVSKGAGVDGPGVVRADDAFAGVDNADPIRTQQQVVDAV